MRIGIDVSILSTRLTGIGYFALSLVRSLAGLRESAQWVLLGAPPQFKGLPTGENVLIHDARNLKGVRRAIWQQMELPRLAMRYDLDVLHCPDFSRPLKSSVPVVNTIHDLSYYSPYAYFSLGSRIYKRSLTRVAMKKSAAIVAVSKFTRDEIMQRFGLDEDKISVIYHGVDLPSEGEALQAGAPFVLYVGTLEERKNVPTLIRGFSLARAQSHFPHRLILAGKRGRRFTRIQAAIENSPYGKDIEVRGYVSRHEILALYQEADAFVLPSFYEGFGLPILEAMAAGTPVVCSRAASLPEVAGDAAEYFDPSNAEELGMVLAKVLGSPELRAEMKRKGRERAKQFSWDECARRYLKAYQTVAG